MVDKGNGSYVVSYIPAEAGLYSVWVCIKAQHVQVSLHLTSTAVSNNCILVLASLKEYK